MKADNQALLPSAISVNAMDDDQAWSIELGLWKGDRSLHQRAIDPHALMALPSTPFICGASQAIEAVQATPAWSNVAFEDATIARPQSDLIVLAYTAHAQRRASECYVAHCTTTYRRNSAGEWLVVQHQQTPKSLAR